MAVLNHPIIRPLPGAAISRLRPGVVIAAALAAVALAAMIQVIQSSDATTRGYQVQQLERRRLELEARVHEKEAEVASLASLDRVEREARTRLGMVPAEQRLYMQMSEPVPREQLLPTRFLPPAEAAPAGGGRPWWRRLLDRLPL